ncbi:MAG: sigma-70 family RNA polymerase sigma factor [Actinomycetota bacterium]|nr:sigma-70 family RNA polymerase sigma factor [Actinomycetota bacterium]
MDPRAEVALLMPEVHSGMDPGSSQRLGVEQVWAEALLRLVRYVRRLGASEEDAHDIAQETATRAIHARLNYEDVEDLLRWCQVVAKRQVIDDYRRRQSREATCEPGLVGIPQVPDSAHIVHESIHLSHTLRAIAQLPPPSGRRC